MLHSTLGAEHSLTVYNGLTSQRGLAVALFWWPLALVLALSYFSVVLRSFSGKVSAAG